MTKSIKQEVWSRVNRVSRRGVWEEEARWKANRAVQQEVNQVVWEEVWRGVRNG